MSYVLESKKEANRLEQQSQSRFYDYRFELNDFKPKNGSLILDAGCGSGVVSRYLADTFPKCKVTGWDGSPDRVQQAKELAAKENSGQNLTFEVRNLLGSAQGVAFDAIICRYVLEHFSNATAKEILKSFFQILKPGGKLMGIDLDGLVHQVYPQSDLIKKFMTRFSAFEAMDLYIGRKLPHMFHEAGFRDISWKTECMDFSTVTDRAQEISFLKERFQLAMPTLEVILDSKQEAQHFVEEYLEIGSQPESTLFYTKFIVCGTKSPLSIVKKR